MYVCVCVYSHIKDEYRYAHILTHILYIYIYIYIYTQTERERESIYF